MNTFELSPEHLKLFKKFQRCVKQFSIEKMDKHLYHFFMYECGFIAHYSIHGFRDEYSGKRFLQWFDVFANPNWMFFIPDNEYSNLRKLCVQYAKEQAPKVYEHFDRLERNRKVMLLNSLSKELGMTVVEKENKEYAASFYTEEENGQLSLFA